MNFQEAFTYGLGGVALVLLVTLALGALLVFKSFKSHGER